jgi:hypothetical protein
LLGARRAGLYKTFAAIDLAFSVMNLSPFAGRATLRKGGVLFIAAEGAQYVNARLQGVKQAKTPEGQSIAPAPFAWVTACPPIATDDALMALIILTKAPGRHLKEAFGLPLALVVVDTLSAAAMFRDADDAAENQR